MMKSIKEYQILVILMIMASILILYNLDNTYLWKDEAHTAQIGYNILNTGVPKVWDGLNILTGSEGNDFNESLVIVSKGWLQFYLASIGITFLGKTTLAARLPSAILALLALIINWFTARKAYKSTRLANLVLFIFVLYVPFLLYSRNCRDYTLVFFFTSFLNNFLIRWDYIHQLEIDDKAKKKKNKLLLMFMSIAIALLFYSNHLFGLVWCVSAGIYTLIFYPKRAIDIIFAIFIGGLLWLPWYVYISIANLPSGYSISSSFSERLLISLWKIQVYFIPFITILILLFIFKIFEISGNTNKYRLFDKFDWFLLISSLTNILVVAIINFFLVNHYFLIVVIATPYLLAKCLTYFCKHSRVFALVFAVLIISTNILNVWPFYIGKLGQYNSKEASKSYLTRKDEFSVYGLLASPDTFGSGQMKPLKMYLSELRNRSYLYDFMSEISSDIDTPSEEIVKYLNKNAKDGESVLYAGTEWEPISYYTGLKLANVISDKISPLQEYFSEYPNKKFAYLCYVPDDQIDWIVISKGGRPLIFDDPNYLEKNFNDFEVYESISYDSILSNSPDLDYHRFKTFDEGKKFYILKRKN